MTVHVLALVPILVLKCKGQLPFTALFSNSKK